MDYFSILKRFQDAITENDVDVLSDDIKSSGYPEVYIDGYRIRLREALRTDYPALRELLGEHEFDRLALEFVEKTPSRSYNLDHYSLTFHAFVAKKLGKSFANEIATLENAIAVTFIEADSEPLEASFMSKITPESFASMTFKPRLASRLLLLTFPVNTWLNDRRNGERPDIPAASLEYIYVYRHNNEVQRQPLSENEYIFLKQLFSGKTVSESLEHLIDIQKQHQTEILENIQNWFAKWLAGGYFRVDS